MSLIREVAAYTAAHEPNTLTYVTSIDEADPLNFFVFERYTDEAAWKVTHMSSPPAKVLFDPAKQEELVEKVVIQVSTEADFGFLHKQGK